MVVIKELFRKKKHIIKLLHYVIDQYDRTLKYANDFNKECVHTTLLQNKYFF